MATFLGQNAEIFVIDSDLKPPKTDKEFLAHGLMQMLIELAPLELEKYVAKNYNDWQRASGGRLLIQTALSNGENLKQLASRDYAKILGMADEVYNHINANIDTALGYDNHCDCLASVLDNMMVEAVFDHSSILMSNSINGSIDDWDEFSLGTGCPGGQVWHLATYSLVHNTDLSEVCSVDDLTDRDVDDVMMRLLNAQDYGALKPGDIQYLVENNAAEWIADCHKNKWTELGQF